MIEIVLFLLLCLIAFVAVAYIVEILPLGVSGKNALKLTIGAILLILFLDTLTGGHFFGITRYGGGR